MDQPVEPAADPAAPVSAPARAATTAAAAPSWLAPVPFAIILSVAQAVLLAAKLLMGFALAIWLLAHAALTLAAVALVWQHRAQITDTTPYALTTIAALISGPIGAGIACLALIRHAGEATHPELLAAWYDRIALAGDVDPVTDLYNTVAMGRALQTSTVPPQVFDAVMTSGTLADRQTALGLIARQFQPSYAPALRHALVSPEPVIRVQAAAVAVKVRAELKKTLAVAMLRSTADLSPADAASLAVELQLMAKSGLLEDDDRDRATAATSRLTSTVVDGLTNPATIDTPLSPAAQSLIETELLALGRFQQFRDLRARKPSSVLPAAPSATGAPHV